MNVTEQVRVRGKAGKIGERRRVDRKWHEHGVMWNIMFLSFLSSSLKIDVRVYE